MGNCEYVSETYGVPACLGRIISFKGRMGIIAEDRGNYIGVNFYEDKPWIIYNLHPTYEVEYMGIGKIRKLTPSQKRYQEYLKAKEWFDGTFKEWLVSQNKGKYEN